MKRERERGVSSSDVEVPAVIPSAPVIQSAMSNDSQIENPGSSFML